MKIVKCKTSNYKRECAINLTINSLNFNLFQINNECNCRILFCHFVKIQKNCLKFEVSARGPIELKILIELFNTFKK